MKKLLIVLVLGICFIYPIHAQQIKGPVVKILNGTLEGVENEGINLFFGIPYAQPPVGELRWEIPQPLKNWKGIRKADVFGPRGMQKESYKDMVFRSKSESEDCLYLNVWSPDLKPKTKLPVFVYFHGGGFSSGDGSESRYDGSSIASKGIVVVTINYRLGIFGFFSHPEITAASSTHASGNYGLLDMNAALNWVKSNIGFFGGDATKVTIGGQSAGSRAVSLHMASPLSKGLFRAAIGESGSAFGINKTMELKEAENLGIEFLASSGLESLADLKKLPAATLIELSKKPGAVGFPVIVDGYFIKDQPVDTYTKGLQADIPLLAGWTSAEVNFKSLLGAEKPTVANYHKVLQKLYGVQANEIGRVYAVDKDEDVVKVATDLATDRYIGFGVWKWIDLHGKTNGKPVFRYFYQQVLPPEKGLEAQYVKPIGAPHSSDIPYALGNLSRGKQYAYTPDDEKTSFFMESYFVNFIKTMDPNGAGLPKWSGLQSSIPKVMYIDSASKEAPEKNQKRYQLMDLLYY